MTDIPNLVQEIKRLNSEVENGDTSEYFAAGAKEGAIDKAQDRARVRLPEDLRDFYRICNGVIGVEHWGEGGMFFQRCEDLWATIEAANNTLAVTKTEVRAPTEIDAPELKGKLFGPLRIPFAHCAETYYFVDLAASPPNGGVGQVLAFDYAGGKIVFVAASLADFLRIGVNELSAKARRRQR